MTAWQRWVQRPQNLWFRKALFQVHLWVGIGIGLYIFAISISGSALVYRRELTRKYARPTDILKVSAHKYTPDEIQQIAQRLYPGYTVFRVYESSRANRPDTVVLDRNGRKVDRLFNPYTGADLGDPITPVVAVVEWLADFHDNLLAGRTGRVVNGIGSILVTGLALTGLVLWWPGIRSWRRSVMVSFKTSLLRFNWSLHSVLGLWFFVFVLLWGISGIYFSFPDPFNALFGDSFLAWLSRVHFGRFNKSAEVIWTILGFVPAALFITGFFMWWNRVLRKKLLQPDLETVSVPSSAMPFPSAAPSQAVGPGD